MKARKYKNVSMFLCFNVSMYTLDFPSKIRFTMHVQSTSHAVATGNPDDADDR